MARHLCGARRAGCAQRHINAIPSAGKAVAVAAALPRVALDAQTLTAVAAIGGASFAGALFGQNVGCDVAAVRAEGQFRTSGFVAADRRGRIDFVAAQRALIGLAHAWNIACRRGCRRAGVGGRRRGVDRP